MILKDWRVFSTTDLKNWTEYPIPLKVSDFTWDETGRAYAAQVINRNGKYYWYISTDGSGIGVAVSDRPEGPYKDAIGKPLLTKDDCFASKHRWACIDPSVFVDDNDLAARSLGQYQGSFNIIKEVKKTWSERRKYSGENCTGKFRTNFRRQPNDGKLRC